MERNAFRGGGHDYRLARPEEARAAYQGLRAALGEALWDLIRADALERTKDMHDPGGARGPPQFHERMRENPYAMRVCTSSAATAVFEAAVKSGPRKKKRPSTR